MLNIIILSMRIGNGETYEVFYVNSKPFTFFPLRKVKIMKKCVFFQISTFLLPSVCVCFQNSLPINVLQFLYSADYEGVY